MKKTSNKRKKRMRTSRRMLTTANILIAVVAVIECILLVSFATYSWIESTSSLIISSGKDGEESMDVADNLNYQIELAADSAVPADMSTYYRTVKYFRFAKSSSPNGRMMYFPKTNYTNSNNATAGYYSVAGYREGDTADYNISYTYFDFKVYNSSNKQKVFFFKPNSDANLFTAAGGDSTVNTKVQNAMRISFTQNEKVNPVTKIYSISGGDTEHDSTTTAAVNNKAGSSTVNVTSLYVKAHEFDANATTPDTTKAVFTSNVGDNEIMEISVRIWLEEKALDGVTAEQLKGVTVTVNLQLVSDNIEYEQIFFDDYSYTDSNYQIYKGKHATDTGRKMYLYAWNESVGTNGTYIAYPMTRVNNPHDSSIPRWSTSVPVEQVLYNLNSTAHATQFDNSFFGYGDEYPDNRAAAINGTYASGSSFGEGKTPIYKWALPGTITATVDPTDNTKHIISNDCKYFTSLGVAKSKAAYGTDESIIGYCRFSHNLTMTAVNFNDYATGLTGAGYNQNAPQNQNFRYINAAVHTTSYDPSVVDAVQTDYDIYYYDLPDTVKWVIFNNNGNSANQTVDIDVSAAADGTCYKCDQPFKSNAKQTCSTHSISGISGCGQTGYKRIYFYNDIEWQDVRIYALTVEKQQLSGDWTGSEMTKVIPPEPTGNYVTYVNYNMFITGALDSASTAAINMTYDETNGCFKAYVPTDWLEGNMYFKYCKAGYYTQTASIQWHSTGNGGSSHNYYALGYEGTNTIVGNIAVDSNLTGAGTWTPIRQITFSTELIDTTIASTTKYYVSTNNTDYYPMYPSSADLLKFSAYVPNVHGENIYFRRVTTAASNNTTTWTTTPVSDNDKIFYPVSNSTGYYHIAVFVDGSFDKLVTKTKTATDGNGTDPDPDNTVSSTLTYSINNVTPVDLFPNVLSGGNRWYIPCSADTDTIKVVWTPYDYTNQSATDTSFEYQFSPRDGIYYVITE